MKTYTRERITVTKTSNYEGVLSDGEAVFEDAMSELSGEENDQTFVISENDESLHPTHSSHYKTNEEREHSPGKKSVSNRQLSELMTSHQEESDDETLHPQYITLVKDSSNSLEGRISTDNVGPTPKFSESRLQFENVVVKAPQKREVRQGSREMTRAEFQTISSDEHEQSVSHYSQKISHTPTQPKETHAITPTSTTSIKKSLEQPFREYTREQLSAASSMSSIRVQQQQQQQQQPDQKNLDIQRQIEQIKAEYLSKLRSTPPSGANNDLYQSDGLKGYSQQPSYNTASMRGSYLSPDTHSILNKEISSTPNNIFSRSLASTYTSGSYLRDQTGYMLGDRYVGSNHLSPNRSATENNHFSGSSTNYLGSSSFHVSSSNGLGLGGTFSGLGLRGMSNDLGLTNTGNSLGLSSTANGLGLGGMNNGLGLSNSGNGLGFSSTMNLTKQQSQYTPSKKSIIDPLLEAKVQRITEGIMKRGQGGGSTSGLDGYLSETSHSSVRRGSGIGGSPFSSPSNPIAAGGISQHIAPINSNYNLINPRPITPILDSQLLSSKVLADVSKPDFIGSGLRQEAASKYDAPAQSSIYQASETKTSTALPPINSRLPTKSSYRSNDLNKGSEIAPYSKLDEIKPFSFENKAKKEKIGVLSKLFRRKPAEEKTETLRKIRNNQKTFLQRYSPLLVCIFSILLYYLYIVYFKTYPPNTVIIQSSELDLFEEQ